MKWAFDGLVLVFSVLLLAELALPPPPPVALTVASNVLLVLFAVEVTRCRDRDRERETCLYCDRMASAAPSRATFYPETYYACTLLCI